MRRNFYELATPGPAPIASEVLKRNRSIDTHNKLVIATKARQTDFNSAIDRHNVEANA